MEPRIATVSQINGYVKKILDSNIILNNVWIKGEISNFKAHYSGHLYITLKDDKSVLKAVMFRSAARELRFKPEDGMKVLARGRISCYEAGGVYQLYIEEMKPDGVGELYIAYEQLRRALEEEGLFDSAHKKPIPKYPERVGVITAPTGAAVRDIINVISRRYPYAEIILYPSLVQGAEAAPNITAGIEYFNKEKLVDTMIVGRGGGSIEDLWAFNEEMVARAIYKSEIPIISAVGHETDFTIADFVADMRAPTPSAAAELSVPSQSELRNGLENCNMRMRRDLERILSLLRARLDRMTMESPKPMIDDSRVRLDYLVKDMIQMQQKGFAARKEKLSNCAAKLNALSPLAVMSRGYAIAMKEDGEIIKSARSLRKGTRFKLKLVNGERRCIVE
jgi:exodeoxyribonuclease VII large subunit